MKKCFTPSPYIADKTKRLQVKSQELQEFELQCPSCKETHHPFDETFEYPIINEQLHLIDRECPHCLEPLPELRYKINLSVTVDDSNYH